MIRIMHCWLVIVSFVLCTLTTINAQKVEILNKGAEIEETLPAAEELAEEKKAPEEIKEAASAEKAKIEVEEAEEVKPEEKAEKPEEGKKPAEEAKVEAQVEEIEGIDTVDLEFPAGNWLLKRIWWEKAKNKFNKIRLTVNMVADVPMKFFVQQNDLEKSVFDPFYRDIGLEQGELQEIVNTLLEKINQLYAREGELNLKERDFLNTLVSEKKRLEKLSNDVKAINDFDNQLDEALTMLLKQVSQARTYENEAWQLFDSIAHELSDQKAQELYYQMDSKLTNIQDISAYLQTKFAEYFNTMVQTAKAQIEQIKETIKNLKEKGIDLKQQIGQFTEPEEVERVPEEKKPEKGWWSRFWSWLTGS